MKFIASMMPMCTEGLCGVNHSNTICPWSDFRVFTKSMKTQKVHALFVVMLHLDKLDAACLDLPTCKCMMQISACLSNSLENSEGNDSPVTTLHAHLPSFVLPVMRFEHMRFAHVARCHVCHDYVCQMFMAWTVNSQTSCKSNA